MADGQDNKNTTSSDDIKNLLAQLKQSFNLAETPVSENIPDSPVIDEAEFEKLEEELKKEGLLLSEEETKEESDLASEDTFSADEEIEEEQAELPCTDTPADAPAEDIEQALDILESTHKAEEPEVTEEDSAIAEDPAPLQESAEESTDAAPVETDWETFLANGTVEETKEAESSQNDVAPWDFQPEFLMEKTPVSETTEPAPLTETESETAQETFTEAPQEEMEDDFSDAPQAELAEEQEPEDTPVSTDPPIQAEAEAPEEEPAVQENTEDEPSTEAPTEDAPLHIESEAPVAEPAPIPSSAEAPISAIPVAEKPRKLEKESRPKEHWYVPDFMRIKERTDRYCDKNLLSLTIRFWLSLIPAILLLVFENYEIFGFDFVIFQNVRTGIWVNLLLLVCSAALAFPELKNGVLALINRRTTSESFLAVSLTAIALYDLLLLLLSIGNPGFSPRLLALLPAFSVCLYLNTQRRYAHVRAASIHAISDGKPMNALVPQFANLVPDEKKALGKLVYEDSLIARTREVRRIDGVNARLRAVCEDARPNNVLLIAAASLSFVAGLVMGIVEGSFEEALLAFCFALSIIVPGALLYTRISPVSRACRRALENGGAILGESSMYLYSELGAVSFEDISAFPAAKVKVCKIKLFNRNPLDRVLCSASGVFSVLGGPLSGVFRESVADIGTTGDVQILSVREDGIVARVDGMEMKIGTGAFMQKGGVELPFDAEDEMFLAGGKVSILYASFGDVPCAKFYLRYMLDRNFVKTVQSLYKNGICTVIRTYDPNINNRLISKIGALNAFSVKVVHKTEEHLGDFVSESADSGVLSHKDAVGASGLLFLCINAVRILRSNVILKIAMAAISTVVFVLLQVIGFAGFDFSVTSVLYQLLWLIPILTASRLYIK